MLRGEKLVGGMGAVLACLLALRLGLSPRLPERTFVKRGTGFLHFVACILAILG